MIPQLSRLGRQGLLGPLPLDYEFAFGVARRTPGPPDELPVAAAGCFSLQLNEIDRRNVDAANEPGTKPPRYHIHLMEACSYPLVLTFVTLGSIGLSYNNVMNTGQ